MKLFQSFVHAFRGLIVAIQEERNLQIQLLAVTVVTSAGFYFEINATEWIVVLLCFGLVISLELINTAIENLCDLLHPDEHPIIGKVKDIAAAAVTVAAGISVVVATLVFGQKISGLLF